MAKSKSNDKKGAKADRKLFNDLCGKHQDTYANADADTGFKAPPGEYVCVLKEVRTGSFTAKKGKQKGTQFPSVKPVFEIVEGEEDIAGRTISMFLSPMIPGILKSALAGLLGDVEDDLQLAVQRLEEEAVDQMFTIQAVEKGEYTNYYVKDRLGEGQEVEDEEEESEEEDD